MLIAGATPAFASTGIEKGKVLVDGGVLYSAYGAQAGTYYARGLAEYLMSRHFGVRLSGFAQFTDPKIRDLQIRHSGASVGVVFHPVHNSVADPYIMVNTGAMFRTGDAFQASPSLAVAGGFNVHVGGGFVNLQAGWYIADPLVQNATTTRLGDFRVQLGVGFTFDTQ